VSPTEHTMHIGEIAERTGLSLRTIRHYDEVGLIKPSGRTDGGFRLYTDDDLERFLVIRRMKPLGFSLDEMADLLGIIERSAGDARDAASAADLDRYIVEARERRARLQQQLAMADEFLERLARVAEQD
jgi:MerR family copper efflux transcriptional regulator